MNTLPDKGEVLGSGYPDWPEEATTFRERKFYQLGIAHARALQVPIDMILHCPNCGKKHIDQDNAEEIRIAAAERGFKHGTRDWENFIEKHEWPNPPHRSHLCGGCGCIWRPADVPTNGVAELKTRGKADTWPATPACPRVTSGTGNCQYPYCSCRDLGLECKENLRG